MKKRFSIILSIVMLLSLTACGSTGGSEPEPSNEAPVSEEYVSVIENSPEDPAVTEPEEASVVESLAEDTIEDLPTELIREVPLPICEEPESLSMWIRLNFMDFDPIQTNADSPILQKVQELTGVHMEYVEVSSASESETFNLMIAGGDYTDIIYNFAKLYTGGIDNAIENDIIVNISDYIDAIPCYESILASDDEVRRAATTDSGNIGAFYSIYEYTPNVTEGLTIRGDWMEELRLDSPVTYEDFENVLRAFKDAYHPEYPLYLPSCGTLSAITMGYEFAYSVAGDNVVMFGAKDGAVMYSPTSDQFRDYLKMMHSWYEDGLISKDFATNGDWMFMHGEYQSMMANGDAGVVSLGAGLYSEFESIGLDVDDNYRLEGIINPRLDADTPAGSTANNRASDAIFSVTEANNKAELACKWCDFWYTETGSMLSTYGIEGESYTLNADGKPVYTDLVLSNPDYSDRSMKNYYSFNASSIMDPAKDLSGLTDHGLAAVEVWSCDEANDSFVSIKMSSLSLTTDESTEYAIICADAQTYCLENVLKFINGDLSVENDWDAFVSVLNGMGVERATEIVQAAYDRYQAR